ncbi:NADH:flavin oxidoreductase [Geoalkalibacter halelectricus]|uniref:NADH:flavin oxidoreductase n=1 Tax=Geoalkalibacter halelectricus TaxID=2847045 RepID=A0ABY5ZK10_9BACT|nr:NADH:flavin oxidoreductase [Geoalkalibacter halelectricus]MDO3380304.1 NADH:flavin oxidoreductase [Geoalkalibacter halelectricus]UWZ79456.1 NADH:flavin oxidoreductase [Geoalkalibacter halelectricus]
MKGKTSVLFEPTRIQGMKLKNRLVRSATWEGMCDEDGRPTPALVDYYRELAEGGVGLIISGFAFVAAEGKPLPGALGLHRDDFAQDLRALTTAVHQAGGVLCAQLAHAGGQTRRALCGGMPLAPSAVAAVQYQPETPTAMSNADIRRSIAAFAAAARRARECGFDAVQLHAAHGYLINQFLSPHTNRRDDDYGGSLVNRARFLLDVYRAVRAAVGTAYPILVKLTGSDHLAEGLGEKEAVLVAQALDALGIDAIEMSSGTPASGELTPLRRNIHAPDQEAYNLSLALAVKAAVRCPVIVVGGIRSPVRAAEIIRNGDADYLALSRPLIRELGLPLRWRDADNAAPSDCTSCNRCFKAALKGKLECLKT